MSGGPYPREQRRKELAIGRTLALITTLGALLVAAPAAGAVEETPDPVARMAFLVNQARLAQGLSPLVVNPELAAAAAAHTKDMVARGYMEHEGRDGSTPQSRAVRHGYQVPPASPWIVVEVISARATAEAATNWLLSDPLHRGVMLRKGWREMGIAYMQGGPYGQFWTIDFGCRPNVLPVHAEATGAGTSLRLTNEECAPAGGNSKQMGRATEIVVSDRPDFAGAEWEPFTPKKPVGTATWFVKLRDSQGRESATAASVGGPSLAAATTEQPAAIPAAPADPPSATGLFDAVPGFVQP